MEKRHAMVGLWRNATGWFICGGKSGDGLIIYGERLRNTCGEKTGDGLSVDKSHGMVFCGQMSRLSVDKKSRDGLIIYGEK